ncbi:STAS domain-containing protein [Dermatophilaceae bacterium Soc4.6]
MQDTLVAQGDAPPRQVTATLGVAVTAEGHDLVQLGGRLHAGCLADVRTTLLRVVATGNGPVQLDLSEVELGDAAAVGLLVEAHQLALRCGRRLVVMEATPRSERLLRAVRVLPRGWRASSARLSGCDEASGPAGVAALTA